MPLLGIVILPMVWWDSPEIIEDSGRKALGGFSKADGTLESVSCCHSGQGFLRVDGEVMTVVLSHPAHVNL